MRLGYTVFALEKGKAAGVYHAVADEAVPTRDIAGVIGHKLNIAVVSTPQDQVPEHFGDIRSVRPDRYRGVQQTYSGATRLEANSSGPAGGSPKRTLLSNQSHKPSHAGFTSSCRLF